MASQTPKSWRKDPAWKYGTEVQNPDPGRKTYVYIECNFCKQKITGGVKRMKEHLASTHRNVKPCPHVPPEVAREIKDYIEKGESAKKKRQENFDELVDSGAYYRGSETHVAAGASNTPFEVEKRRVRGPMDRYVAHDTDQDDEDASNLKEVMSSNPNPNPNPKVARRKVCLDIGRFFFENGLPFNPVDSPSFVSMCRSIAAYGTGLKTPSRHDLSTWVLKEEVETTELSVEEVKKTWIQTGVSILSDGWKDMKGRSLINFLVNNPYGTVFLKSVDASNVVKNANKLFELLDGIVEEVGEDLVVQIVTDNASNYKAAGNLLMKKRKRLYWTPCAAHCIDLMLEKIGELPLHKNALSNARTVSKFIYNHGFVLAMMRKFTQRELIRPAVTRFATAFLTLESMVQSKQPLEAMFTSSEWASSTWASKSDGKKVKKIILSENFWQSVLYALHTTRPLVKVLRMVDGEQMPAMGFIYGAMDEAKKEIAKNLGNDINKYKEIWEIVDAKWDFQLHREIHAAAHYLNPRYQYAENFLNHREIKKGLMSCMEKMVPDESLIAADLQLDKFRNREGSFGKKVAKDTYKTRTPANWWDKFGDDTPELQSFAVKVLSLTCSASACERNWSMFNQVHTKKRNRLTTQKLNSLVYVMYNRRLRGRQIQLTKPDIDPLVIDHLASDDEWCVSDGNEDELSGDGDVGQMNDEEFEALLDHVPRSSEGTSRGGRGRGRGDGGSRSGKRKARTLVDEDELEWEDGDEEDADISG